MQGNEPHEILVGLLNITRDLLLKTLNNNYSDMYYTSIDFQNELNKFSYNISKNRIIEWHSKLKNVDYQIKTSDNPRLWLEIHLTSLLEKNDNENIINNVKNNNVNLNQKTINNKELITNKVISDNNKELITNQDNNKNSQDDSQTDYLKEKWELILSKLELPSTKMLLSQQAELASIDSNEVLIALSPNWENMIKSRKVIIEDAIKKVFGDKVKLNFSSKKININNTTKSKEKVIKKLNENQERQSTNFQNPLPSSNKPQTESYDNSSKNLANFFNGEIIDLDE